MKKIVLYPNPERDRDFAATRKASALLTAAGCRCVTLDDVKVECLPGLPAGEAFHDAQAAVSFGGDGTILRCARLAAPLGVPVLGVNLGRMGFLSAVGAGELELLTALAGPFAVAERMMLSVELMREGSAAYADLALNDAVLTRGLAAQSVSLSFDVDGQRVGSFVGDGLIVATPTGSTGYALSAGGPVVEPDAPVVLLTPICAHTSYAHSFVFSADRTVTLFSQQFATRLTFLSVDGGEPVRLLEGDEVRIRRSDCRARFVMLPRHTFLESVQTKIYRV